MQSASEAPLVATKWFIPRLRPNRVERERLRELLDRSRHLVLVSAPAGSGKSTLLADWATATDAQVAWVSLDRGDDEPARFLDYVLASLRQAEAIGWTESTLWVYLLRLLAFVVILIAIVDKSLRSGASARDQRRS